MEHICKYYSGVSTLLALCEGNSLVIGWFTCWGQVTASHWFTSLSWCLYPMETRSALLALCEGNPPVTTGFPSQRASSGAMVWRHHGHNNDWHFSNIHPITVTSHKRHAVSNQLHPDSLFDSLFRLTATDISNICINDPLSEESISDPTQTARNVKSATISWDRYGFHIHSQEHQPTGWPDYSLKLYWILGELLSTCNLPLEIGCTSCSKTYQMIRPVCLETRNYSLAHLWQ